MSEKSKLMQLESARGIAALIVVLYHFHSTSPLTWIGTRSYSVYMVHFLAWQLATLALRKIGLDPMQMPTWQSTLVVLTMVGVVLGVSALTYAWIERPFMQRGARRPNV